MLIGVVFPKEIELRLPSVDALRAELPNLLKRRAFVAGAEGVEMRQACALVLVHPGAGTRLALPAEVVWVGDEGPGKGIGLELQAVDESALRAFVESPGEQPLGDAAPDDAVRPERESFGEDGESEPDALGSGEDGEPLLEREGRAQGLYEKVRRFSVREREVCARHGVLSERIALERCYGPSVWEAILQNPQVTPPEVARIARNGTIPKPLVGVIVANGGWLSVGEVQRALLSNPRVTGPHLDRVLRALSPSDLKRVMQQSAYRAAVRQAAQKLAK